MNIYIVTENEGTFEVLKNDLERTFKSVFDEVNVIKSKSIPKPDSEVLIPAWEKLVLSAEVTNCTQSSVVIFDNNVKDKVGLYLMLGMTIASRNPELLDGTVILNDFENEFDKKLFSCVPTNINKDNKPISLTVSDDKESSEDEIVFKSDFSYDILKVFEDNNIKSINVDLDNRSLPQLVLLGFCYIRGIEINMIGSKKYLVLTKLGNFKLK